MIDLWLATAHHILVFSLVAMLAVEAALVRDGMGPAGIMRVARLDAGYGATAGLIVVVGLLRVIYGARGYVYYVENVWFWAKMGSFVLIALLSIPPTLRFREWTKKLKADARFAIPAAELRSTRLYLRLQLLFIAAVLLFAAMMARFLTVRDVLQN